MTTTTRTKAPAQDSTLAKAVRDFCRKGFKPQFGKLAQTFPSNPLWAAVRRAGTELWLDTGDMDEAKSLWCREFSALTTNNTLLNKEVQKGIYDKLCVEAADALRKADAKLDEQTVVQEIAFILNAVHGLKLVETFDAMVSVELHTDLANDLEGAVSYGKRFHAICPERFYVKVPLTPSGCLAARRLSEAGIDVNFTLGFSARQNYVIALTAKPAFANVFMGRLNAFAAESKLNDGNNVGERATAASQRVLDTVRKGPGGVKTRQIGASMRTGSQVATLAGLDVFTMPTKVAKEFVALAMDPAKIKRSIDSQFEVVWNAGLDEKAMGLGVFWDVSEDVGKAMCKLAGEDIAAMTPQSLVAFLAANGMGSLFPDLTAAERARIVKEGKAPVLASWRDEVKKGRLAWDSLFTEAGLGSFAQDQKALDDRIRKMLKG